jgi:proliferating cell nuclear antigen PCNA
MKIIKISECGSILVHLALDSKNFDYFHCSSPTMMISVDITNLNNKLQLITGEDPIVIYMSKDNRSVLYIKSSTEGNGAGGEESSIELALMEEEYVEMKIPKTEFISMITIKSNDFHNMCKKIQNNTHVVEIIMVGDRITFRGNDEGGKLQKTFIDNSCKNNDDDDEDNANQDGKLQKKKDKIVKVDNEIVQGKFNLKSITGFSKCNKLSETITIYMKNNYPLLLCIEVSALGKLYVFLTPVEDDQKDN